MLKLQPLLLYTSVQYIGYNLNILTHEEQFVFLMNFDDQRHLQELAKFIYLSFNKHLENLNSNS